MHCNLIRLTAISALLLLLGSCGNKTASQEDPTAEDRPSSWADTLDLRRAYRQYYEARSDWPPAWPHEEEGKLHPVDEALRDTLFFVARERLREAVARKDAFALLDMLDENVKVDFGGSQGVADFVKVWKLDSEENIARSPVWPTLDRLLALGGTFSEGGKAFTTPYVFSRWPEDVDAFTHGAVIGQGVRLREAPDLDSRIVKTLSYELVEIQAFTPDSTTLNGETFPWIELRTRDDRSGYVWGKYVYSPIGFRAGFYREGQSDWKIRFLLAGD